MSDKEAFELQPGDFHHEFQKSFPVLPLHSFPEEMRPQMERFRRQAMLRRRANLCANLLYWSALILIVAWLLAQAFDRTPPVDVSMSLMTSQVEPGDRIKFRLVAANRRRACEVTISWIVSDGLHEVRPFSEDPIPANQAPPIVDRPIRSFPLWHDAEPGQGKIRITRSYVCPGNYLHRFFPIVVTSPDYVFEIVPKKGSF